MNETYDIKVETVDVSSDTAFMESGRHLVDVLCGGCHGSDLGGTPFFNDPSLGSLPAPNVTSGNRGVAAYTDTDWVRAIRHGVDPAGKPLMSMPAGDLYYLSDADLGAIIAVMKTVPPVDRSWPEPDLNFLATVLAGLGQFGDVVSVEDIDHDGPRPHLVSEAVNTEYAGYMVKLFGAVPATART